MPTPDEGWLTEGERRTLAAAVDRLIPPDHGFPGAAAAGAVDYVDRLLSAFQHDPPRVWAGRTSGDGRGEPAPFEAIPLSTWEAGAWRARIEGPGGWQERYRTGLAALDDGFADLEPDEQDARLAADPDLAALLYEHACEATYGDPVYGGNRGGAGWDSIGFPGDPIPRGYTAGEVREP